MELPSKYFENFPIEFKKINPEDFRDEEQLNFNVGEKIMIEPNADGYIYDSLKNQIEMFEKSTVVINAPVGSGKTYTILKLIKKIYEVDENSLIIVATPFVSLVQQYVDELHTTGGIPKNHIYNYLNLGRNSESKYTDKRIQVVTVNTLLGNPGQDAFENSKAKQLYLMSLIDKCETQNKKVFFIYDEIHDAIQNFKEEYVFNLWKWKNVIFKNIIISATYNEASKTVIKYLAELTDSKIQIIESSRKQIPNKQSKLSLHYSNDFNYTPTTDELVNLVEDLLKRNKQIDILSYSKTLAKNIINDREGIGKKLIDRFGKLNNCTSQLLSNQRVENTPQTNRFNQEMCNVGTNFKSGVNITKDDHALIIIMPPRSSRLMFGNKFGIFSEGTNNIIQALARQRTQGEIHIILPRPDKFNYDSLVKTSMTVNQRTVFENFYSRLAYFDDKVSTVNYKILNEQGEILLNFYRDTLVKNAAIETLFLSKKNRVGLPRLEFPPFEIFALNDGERFLANNYKFFGGDLSAYITYCSFTNQFVNCELSQINYKKILYFEEGQIQKKLFEYFDDHYGVDYYNFCFNPSNFNMFYNRIRLEFFDSFQIKFRKKDMEDWKNILPYKNSLFEIQLLIFCHSLFQKGYDYYNTNFQIVDKEYNRSNYFLDSISISDSLNLKNSSYDKSQKQRIKAFQNLSRFRDKVIENISISKRGEKFNYLPVKPFPDFVKNTDLKDFDETLQYFLEVDPYIKNEIFAFRRNFVNKPTAKKIEAFYTIILSDFFEFNEFDNYPKIKINGKSERVKPIKNILPLPITDNTLNLVIDSDFDETYLNAVEEAVESIGDYKNYGDYLEKLKSMFDSL